MRDKPGSEWTLDLTKDWQPTHAVMRRWYKAPFEGSDGLEKFPLDPAALKGISRDADDNVAVELLAAVDAEPG